jgi:TPR repeat protein
MSNTQRFQAIKQIMIDSKAKYANMKPLTPDMIDTIEKFVRNHNLKIQLSDVIGYYDLALFGSGKKGMLLTADFLYFSENGKKENPVYFKDLVSVSKKGYDLTMIYANGKNMKFFASIFVDYLLELMMKIIELDSVVSKSSNEADQKIDTVTSSIQSVLNQKMKEEEEQKKREEQARLEMEKRQKEAEEQARLEAEKKLKDLEEQRRKEAEEKAKIEAQRKLEEEKRIQEEIKATIAAKLKQKELEEQKKREEQARLEEEKRQKEAEEKARLDAEAKQKEMDAKKAEQSASLESEWARIQKEKALIKAKLQELENKRQMQNNKMNESDLLLLEKEKARRERIDSEKTNSTEKQSEEFGVDGLLLEKKIENQKYSYESKKLMEDLVCGYGVKKMIRGTYLKQEDMEKIRKYKPSINLDEVMGFYDASVGFVKKWMIFTFDTYYDSCGNAIRYSDISNVKYVIDKPHVVVSFKNRDRKTCQVPYDSYTVEVLLRRASNFDYKQLWTKGVEIKNTGQLEKAFLLFLEAAIHGKNPEAMNEVGIHYNAGNFVKKDKERSLYWYEKAAHAGNKYAASNAAYTAKKLKKYSQAYAWFTTTVDDFQYNEKSILNELGLMELYGRGRSVDISKAIKYFERGKKLGNEYCVYNLALIYTYYRVDYEKALELVNEAISMKHNGSKALLGRAYMYGRGIVVNTDEAYRLFNEDTSSLAPVALGDYYLEIKHDVDAAIEHYKKAIDKGNLNGYSSLGQLYRNGEYTAVDLDEALYWFEKGVDADSSDCMLYLGEMVRDGDGIVKNEARALNLFKASKNLGNFTAAAALAMMYARGLGTAKDTDQANKNILLALRLNSFNPALYYADMVINGDIKEFSEYLLIDVLLDKLQRKGINEKALHKRLFDATEYYMKLADQRSVHHSFRILYEMSLYDITDAKLKLLEKILNDSMVVEKCYLNDVTSFVKDLYLAEKISRKEAVSYAKKAGVPLVFVTGISERNRVEAKRLYRLALRAERSNKKDEAFVLLGDAVLLNPDFWQACSKLAGYYNSYSKYRNDRYAYQLYQMAILSPDYSYDPKTEFLAAEMKFDGRGCEKDLSAGFAMLKAVENGYSAGIDKLILKVSISFDAIYYEYAWKVAELKGSDPLYEELREDLKTNCQKEQERMTEIYNKRKSSYDKWYTYLQSYYGKAKYVYDSDRDKIQSDREYMGQLFVANALLGSCPSAKDMVLTLSNEYGVQSRDLVKVVSRYFMKSEVYRKRLLLNSSDDDALMNLREYIVNPDQENYQYVISAVDDYMKWRKDYVNLDSYYRHKLISHYEKAGKLKEVQLLKRSEETRKRLIKVAMYIQEPDKFLKQINTNKYWSKFYELNRKYGVDMILETKSEVYHLSSKTNSSVSYTNPTKLTLRVQGDKVHKAVFEFFEIIISDKLLNIPNLDNSSLSQMTDVKYFGTDSHVFVFMDSQTDEEIFVNKSTLIGEPLWYPYDATYSLIRSGEKTIAIVGEYYEDYQNIYILNALELEKDVDQELLEDINSEVDKCWALYDEQKYELAFVDVMHLAEFYENAKAQNMLGYLYCHGKGTEQDVEEAYEWFEQSIAQGFSAASINMGNLLYTYGIDEETRASAHQFYFDCVEKTSVATAQRALEMCEAGLVENPEYQIVWKMRLTQLKQMDAVDEILEKFKSGISDPECRLLILDFIKELAQSGNENALALYRESPKI